MVGVHPGRQRSVLETGGIIRSPGGGGAARSTNDDNEKVRGHSRKRERPRKGNRNQTARDSVVRDLRGSLGESLIPDHRRAAEAVDASLVDGVIMGTRAGRYALRRAGCHRGVMNAGGKVVGGNRLRDGG